MKTTRRAGALLVGFSIVLTLAGCAGNEPSDEQTEWLIQPETPAPDEWVGEWRIAQVPEWAPTELSAAALDLTHTDFSATVGCNGMFGTYEIQDDTFTVITAAATEMGCEPGLMDAEEILHGNLDGGVLIGDSLVFTTSQGDLEFDRLN